MLTLSKPISAGQAQAYHKSEFANAKENYYTDAERVRGEWQGQLAARRGLRGEVNEEQFARLSEGQHPATGEALIRRQQAREYINDKGETVRTKEHRAGWDATFSAPKSVSLTALVGGDDRVRDAHRGERARGAGRDGKVRMGGGQVRARQQPSGRSIRRAAVAHARGDLKCH
jgi:TrwC relaxase